MTLQTLIKSTQYDHSQQVAKISAILAKAAGYGPEDIDIITQAAAFHDVGKRAIPKEILLKPRPLTPEEFTVVKTHTDIGYRQLTEAIDILTVAAAMCRDHHEWVDGTKGYHGLCGEDIHPMVKIVSISDVYDALYSKRAYKARWSIPEIRDYFAQQSGHQFDPDTVRLLFSVLDDILKLYTPEAKNGLET